MRFPHGDWETPTTGIENKHGAVDSQPGIYDYIYIIIFIDNMINYNIIYYKSYYHINIYIIIINHIISDNYNTYR